MTNKDLSAYSKTIFICFIICLFKPGKKMQANCNLSLAKSFHIHYFLFTYLVVGKQFPAVKLFSYLGKQKVLSKYIGLLQMFHHQSVFTTSSEIQNTKVCWTICFSYFGSINKHLDFFQKKFSNFLHEGRWKKKCSSCFFLCFDWIKYSWKFGIGNSWKYVVNK